MSRIAVLTASTAMVFGTVTVATESSAFAYPQSCRSDQTNSLAAHSSCNGGSGSHRVYIKCSDGLGAYGPWVGTELGTWSRASCPGRIGDGRRVVFHEVQLQGD